MKNLRTIILLSIFGLMLLGYLVFFVFDGEPDPVRITYRLSQPRGNFDPQHPVYRVRFDFDRPYTFRRVEVVEVEDAQTPAADASAAPEVEPEPAPTGDEPPALVEDRAYTISDEELAALERPAAEEEGGPMWRLVVGDSAEQRTHRMVHYGDELPGMELDPQRPAKRLNPQTSYRLRVVDDQGRTGELVFQTQFFQKPMTMQEYMRERLRERMRRRP